MAEKKGEAAAEKAATNPLTGSPYSKRYYKLLEKRKALPVWTRREKLLEALSKHQTVVVCGVPGSGKSTQIPQFVLEAGYARNGKQIASTQPRRVVATSVSTRVAQEMDVKLGEEVGYSIRFENYSGPKTVIKYLTDGILLREAVSDKFLECYKVIILDEAHLQTLATDILLGFLRSLLKVRKDLKLIVLLTAPFEAKKFQDFLKPAQVVKILPKLHAVDIVYAPEPVQDHIEASIEKVVQILLSEPSGDILVFLTGMEEINNCSWRLTKVISDLGDRIGPVKIVPLHSSLSLEMQKKVFKAAQPPLRKGGPLGRKIVLSTDIAESSLAIDGIAYVIDPGFSKQKVYNPQLNVESLLILPISKPSAYRRAACARRSQPGKCFRLYTEDVYTNSLPLQVSPEILRANLASTILVLNKLGINDLFQFGFIDPPSAEAVTRGIESLNHLDALDADGNLTEVGELMCEFPLDPQMSKMIVASPSFHCSNEILSIAAMLSVSHCFLQPVESLQAADEAKAWHSHVNGDHLTLLNIFHSYMKGNGNSLWCKENFVNEDALKSAVEVRNHLQSIMRRLNLSLCSTDFSSPDYHNNIRKCMLAGYFMQAARLGDSGHYVTVKDNHVVDLHPSCCLTSKPAWVIYHDFVVASRNFVRTVTDVQREWLIDVAPHYYQISTTQGAS